MIFKIMIMNTISKLIRVNELEQHENWNSLEAKLFNSDGKLHIVIVETVENIFFLTS